MEREFQEIPERILQLALGALSQANTYSVYTDPGLEYRRFMSVLSTAHAGELFLKAIIAKEHPLLIFKDIFSLDDKQSSELDLISLLQRGRTHDFEKLPQIVWAVTGTRITNLECYEKLRKARNAIQHFVAPPAQDFQGLSLEFIYTIIDPLICEHFDIYAIEYHEDFAIGYDYIVQALLQKELRFSIPLDFNVSEISLREEAEKCSLAYREWFTDRLHAIGKTHLLTE